MLALGAKRLAARHPWDRNVAVADTRAKRRERIDELRADAIVADAPVVEPYRLRQMHVIKRQHALLSGDRDLPRLSRIQPGRVQVDQNVARIAERRKDRVLDPGVDPRPADSR